MWLILLFKLCFCDLYFKVKAFVVEWSVMFFDEINVTAATNGT